MANDCALPFVYCWQSIHCTGWSWLIVVMMLKFNTHQAPLARWVTLPGTPSWAYPGKPVPRSQVRIIGGAHERALLICWLLCCMSFLSTQQPINQLRPDRLFSPPVRWIPTYCRDSSSSIRLTQTEVSATQLADCWASCFGASNSIEWLHHNGFGVLTQTGAQKSRIAIKHRSFNQLVDLLQGLLGTRQPTNKSVIQPTKILMTAPSSSSWLSTCF